MTDGSLLGLAFTAGMVATINPCGFAMLPAYLSYFVGLDQDDHRSGGGILRALGVGAAVTAGFLVVFLLAGIVITSFSLQLEAYLPWATIVIGTALVALAIAMLRGYEPSVRLPKLKGTVAGRQASSMFVFGVSYAVASLSCTIGVFLSTVSVTFTRQSFGSGLQVFLAYGLGMGLVLTILTVLLVVARESAVRRFRRLLPMFNRISAALLGLAGIYLVYYGWYELRVQGGELGGGGPAEAIFELSGTASNWVQQTGAIRIGLLLAAAFAAAVVATIVQRRRRRPTDQPVNVGVTTGTDGTDAEVVGDTSSSHATPSPSASSSGTPSVPRS